MPRKRPVLPTDNEPKELVSPDITELVSDVAPVARFSVFPFHLLARYINHKVEFEVFQLPRDDFGWEVRKL